MKIIVERVEGHFDPVPLHVVEVDEQDTVKLAREREYAKTYAANYKKGASNPPEFRVTIREEK